MVFILPQAASRIKSRIVSLPNPRQWEARESASSAILARYLVCPESGVYELTRVGVAPTGADAKKESRSWMVEMVSPGQDGSEQPTPTTGEALTTPSADLYLATPLDPLFLVLPALWSPVPSPNSISASTQDVPPASRRSSPRKPKGGDDTSSKKRMFLSADDHLDALVAHSPHLAHILRQESSVSTTLRALFESRMAACCDTVDAGDEKMYRLSERKTLAALLGKARAMLRARNDKGNGDGRLPDSLEERFVRKALEAPIVGVAAPTAATPAVNGPVTKEDDGSSSVSTPLTAGTSDSQTSVATTTTSTSTTLYSAASFSSIASTAATSVSGDDTASVPEQTDVTVSTVRASPEVVALQRLRVALDLVLARYVPPSLASALRRLLKASTGQQDADLVDFAPLDEYLATVERLKAEVQASRSLLDYGGGGKRGRGDDEETMEREEKRRKKEEEEKRKKATETRGVRELKKVDVSGMKKLSEFFKKK